MKKLGIIAVIMAFIPAVFLSVMLIISSMAAPISKEENLEEPFTAEELEELEKVESLAEYEPSSLEFYRQMLENLDIVEVYDCSELTAEILENRDGKIIIEECIGTVTNKETGAGKLLNYTDPDYYYISYSNVDGIRDGSVVLTYFIYNPDSNYIDDILYRFDYIIEREFED